MDPVIEAAEVSAENLALASRGYLCLQSAALHWGWAVKTVPYAPHIALPRGRRLPPSLGSQAHWHRIALAADDVSGVATSAECTLSMCGRLLSFDEALAVADSALRADYSQSRLVALARDSRGPGSRQFRRVAQLADARAANPFESALRARCLEVSGLSVIPQRTLTIQGRDLRPDLVDLDLQLVIEADSFEWHGHRSALDADARRYNAMAVAGWLVLRFSYEQVMGRPDDVRQILQQAVRLRSGELSVGHFGLPISNSSWAARSGRPGESLLW